MKIQVVKDKAGKVVATFEKSGDHSVTPVLEAGHSVHEMDVADDYRSDIKGFYAKHGHQHP